MKRNGASMLTILFGGLLLLTGAASAGDAVRDHKIVPEDYFDLATITGCAVSPDGQYAVYRESRWGDAPEDGRGTDLWIVDLNTHARRRLTFERFGAGHPTFSPDGKWIYVTGHEKRGGEAKAPYDGSNQVWRITPSSGDIKPVTRVKGGVRLFELGPRGDCLYYTTAKKVHEGEWTELKKRFGKLEYGHGITSFNAIHKLDLVSWRTETVHPADRVIHEMTLSPEGNHIAMVTTEDDELIFKEGWSRVEVLDLCSGKIRRITSDTWRKDHPSPHGWIEEVTWAPDGKALAFAISWDGYATRLYATECGRACMSGKCTKGCGKIWEVKRPDFAAHEGGLTWRSNRTLCFQADVKARVRVYAIHDVRDGGQGATEVLTPGEWVAGGFAFSEGGWRMVAVLRSVSSEGDLYVVRNGECERVTNVNPQQDRWMLPKIEIFKWTGADGDPVEGILELPPDYEKGKGPLPLVVELHGGPTASTKKRLRLWIYGRAYMAARGYALFSPNYHGSTGYGDAFTSKLIGRENEIEVTDIRTGIEALVAAGIADRDRIGVMGWSNGGFLTNSMITKHPELFKAASSGAGVLDQALQWATEDTPGHVINYMQGLPWQNPEAYVKGSPLYDLDKVTVPTLIHVGGADPRVPPAHSRALYRGLRHYVKTPVELVVYPGEPHGLTTRENRTAKVVWDLAWFDKYLLGKGCEDAEACEPCDADKCKDCEGCK